MRGLSQIGTAWRPAWLPILLHLGIALVLAATLNIWLDEAYSLDTTAGTLSRTIDQAIGFELQPPLYFVAMNLWRRIDGSIFFARLFSILCMVLTLVVVEIFARRHLRTTRPAWVVACIAFNPFAIWAAVEIRAYALAILLSALLLLLFFEAFLGETSRRALRAAYVLAAVLAVHSQYYLGFLLVANAVALVALRRWRPLRSYLLCMVVAGVFILPIALAAVDQVTTFTASGERIDGRSLPNSLGVIYWNLQQFLLPVGWEALCAWRRWIVRLALLALVLMLALRYRRALSVPVLALGAMTASTALGLAALVLLTTTDLAQPRHVAVLFVPAILAVLAALGGLGLPRVWWSWLVVVLVFYATALYGVYAPLAKRGDWARVGAYLAHRERPGQPIAVFTAAVALPLAHYYGGVNALVPLPAPDPLERYLDPRCVVTDERQVAAMLGGASDVWLVMEDVCEAPHSRAACSIVQRFVAKHYVTAETKDFHHSRVHLLRRRLAAAQ